MQNTSRLFATLCLAGLAYWFGVALFVGQPDSADLRAAWLAGTHFSSGDIAQVYRMSDGFFTMEPPELWIKETRDMGLEIAVFPFIYPPLWAWLTSFAVNIMTFDLFASIATAVNTCLIPFSFYLAWRIIRPNMALTNYLLSTFVVGFFLMGFVLALRENQPQILVSFLILLAIERQRAGASILGGLALALAASIKLYPAIFALVWIAAGEKRAASAFAIFGGLLGATSVAVAEWPMHEAFLGELSAISDSILLTFVNFSLAPFLGAVFAGDLTGLVAVSTQMMGQNSTWMAAPKPDHWQMLESIAQGLGLIGILAVAFLTKLRDPWIWPAILILVSWLSPLSWAYHYMTALVFLPCLVEKFGLFRCALFLIVAFFPASTVFFATGAADIVTPIRSVIWSNLGLIALFFVFVRVVLSKRPALEQNYSPAFE